MGLQSTSELLRRNRRPRLFWSSRRGVRFDDGNGLSRDLGRMVCQENACIWCRRYGDLVVDCDEILLEVGRAHCV
jgi:hypothetical protein